METYKTKATQNGRNCIKIRIPSLICQLENISVGDIVAISVEKVNNGNNNQND